MRLSPCYTRACTLVSLPPGRCTVGVQRPILYFICIPKHPVPDLAHSRWTAKIYEKGLLASGLELEERGLALIVPLAQRRELERAKGSL